MRIVLVRAGALGDVVLAVPVLRHLRSHYPDADIQVIGYPAIWEVAGPLVDSIHSVDAPRFAGLLGSAPGEDLLTWLEGTDRLIVWSTRPLHPRVTAQIPCLQASPYPPPGIHAARWYLQSMGAPADTLLDTTLLLTQDEYAQAESALSVSHPVVLHPGAGAPWKRWPASRFAQLADALTEDGHPVVLLEGPADADAVRAVRDQAHSHLPVHSDLGVRTLGALLSRAAVFVGNDTGVTHLAAAVGAPTVAIFGPTDPVSWHPLGRSRVVRHCLRQATYQGDIRVCQDPECLERVETAAVLATTQNFLAGSG